MAEQGVAETGREADGVSLFAGSSTVQIPTISVIMLSRASVLQGGTVPGNGSV
jgi:hypothetical protein